MIRLGITGGIGSGKSVVCEILKLHNIPIFDADKEAKLLNNSSKIIKDKLRNHFGEEIYTDGKLNNKRFAELIFTNEENLKAANSIIHPEVANTFLKWCDKKTDSQFVAIESAILFEARFDKYIDKSITVYSPIKTRIERVEVRDRITKDTIMSRIKNQMSDEEKANLAHYIIYNDNKHSLISQVSEIIKDINLCTNS